MGGRFICNVYYRRGKTTFFGTFERRLNEKGALQRRRIRTQGLKITFVRFHQGLFFDKPWILCDLCPTGCVNAPDFGVQVLFLSGPHACEKIMIKIAFSGQLNENCEIKMNNFSSEHFIENNNISLRTFLYH